MHTACEGSRGEAQLVEERVDTSLCGSRRELWVRRWEDEIYGDIRWELRTLI